MHDGTEGLVNPESLVQQVILLRQRVHLKTKSRDVPHGCLISYVFKAGSSCSDMNSRRVACPNRPRSLCGHGAGALSEEHGSTHLSSQLSVPLLQQLTGLEGRRSER